MLPVVDASNIIPFVFACLIIGVMVAGLCAAIVCSIVAAGVSTR